MLFNSYEFLLFLPAMLLLYALAERWLRAQNAVLLAGSYLFYAWWHPKFLLLIVGITLIGYVSALGIEWRGRNSRAAGMFCGAAIVGSLGVLGAFKYYDFFVGAFNEAMQSLGLSVCLPLWGVLLPVGISFYTFQVLGYVIDVRRGTLPACRDLLGFAAFVSFFPQLVAGPIERAGNLLPQMQRRREVSEADVTDGLRQMLWGFAKKMLLADRCAPIVQAIYANPAADGTDLWAAAVLFAFQIYGDFSGYSDIAIGTARLFGIRLTRNFRVPYFSRGPAEFWRRWHISLNTWFVDYVYIPLGGSRRGLSRQLRNVAVVFLVSGLWHGANWTFVCWGAYHALLCVPGIVGRRLRPAASGRHSYEIGRLSLKGLCQMAGTFVLVCIGWVFFRSESIASAFARLGRMFADLQPHTPYGGLSAFYPVVAVVAAEWLMRNRRHGLDFRGTGLLRHRPMRWACYYALIVATLYWGGAQTAFIYFQF